MSDDVVPSVQSERPSLTMRLSQVPPLEPVTPEPADEREALAKKRVGTKIKGWRLVRLLGVGALTAVYEAYFGDGDDGDHGVLKLLIGSVAKNERVRGLFLRSAYAANRFRHPRVLAINLDGTDAHGAPFVVRTWEDAKPLADAAAARELTDAQVLRIGEQVLDALEMAHAHGVVHGAVTPENILMTARGSIRLCDFGTPPGALGADVGQAEVLGDLRIGPYSPPERCLEPPAAVSETADIYGVAACLYFVLTKQPPRGAARTRDELANAPARPVRELAPAVGEGLASVIDHALSRDPGLRYDSAYAMLGDVRRVMAGRRPKLGDALRPVPSGSFAQLSTTDTASSRKGYVLQQPGPQTTGTLRAQREKEWKGNVFLILAIALLVGVATFVLVRERIEDQRNGISAPPP